MNIHLKLDLISPAELDAFGVFCASVATARRAEPKRSSISDLLFAEYGIDKSSNQTWQAHTTAHPDKTAGEPQPPVNNEHVAKGATAFTDAEIAANETPAATPTRERGKPSPGHKRRTNAEIAEDDAFLAAAGKELSDVLTSAANETPAISTGEERVGPEDDAATQEADAADEATETAAAKTADAKPTYEDIRTVLGNYQKVYGLPACMTDGPLVLQEVCGEGVVKVASVPDDKIGDVIVALKAAGKTNRFQRAVVSA